MSDKILISFSGGINSTYSLYRWLTETIVRVVVRYDLTILKMMTIIQKNFKELKKLISNFLKEYRDFDLEMGEFPKEYVEERIPIRTGFTKGT